MQAKRSHYVLITMAFSGYDLVGAEELNCEALTRKVAKWDDKEPTCERKLYTIVIASYG